MGGPPARSGQARLPGGAPAPSRLPAADPPRHPSRHPADLPGPGHHRAGQRSRRHRPDRMAQPGLRPAGGVRGSRPSPGRALRSGGRLPGHLRGGFPDPSDGVGRGGSLPARDALDGRSALRPDALRSAGRSLREPRGRGGRLPLLRAVRSRPGAGLGTDPRGRPLPPHRPHSAALPAVRGEAALQPVLEPQPEGLLEEGAGRRIPAPAPVLHPLHLDPGSAASASRCRLSRARADRLEGSWPAFRRRSGA